MTERQWQAYKLKVSREDLFLRFLDRWIPRLSWVVLIGAAAYFGWGTIAWFLE